MPPQMSAPLDRRRTLYDHGDCRHHIADCKRQYGDGREHASHAASRLRIIDQSPLRALRKYPPGGDHEEQEAAQQAARGESRAAGAALPEGAGCHARPVDDIGLTVGEEGGHGHGGPRGVRALFAGLLQARGAHREATHNQRREPRGAKCRRVQNPLLATAGTSGRSVLPRTIIRAVQSVELVRYATRAIVVRGEVHSRAQI